MDKDDEEVCHCLRNNSCQKKCRNYIEYPNDNNCCLVSIEKNGELTLEEVGERLGISFVRVHQIEQKAMKKLLKKLSD